MDPFDRVWKSLNHEEPDRVPIYESSIEPLDLTQGSPALYFQPGLLFFPTDLMKIATKPIIHPIRRIIFKIMKNPEFLKTFVKSGFNITSKMHRKLSIDLMGFSAGLPMVLSQKVFEDFKVINGNTIIAPNGEVVTKISENFGAISRFGFLKTPEDYDKYIEMDPDHKINYFLAQNALKAAKGKIALQFMVYGAAAFEPMSDMFGFKNLFKLMVKKPNFIKRVVNDLSYFSCTTVEYLAERGVKLFYMTNDLGQNNRLIISPRMYRNYFKEAEKKFCDKVHRFGGKVIMHSCGNIMELIDDLIEVGIDALHPWQPYAGMDIFEGKKKWGDKLTLIGNVSIEKLTHGTKNEIVDYVKKLMSELKPNGGFILSSSHSIVPTVKWQNYAAMLWAARKYGKYFQK